MRRRIIDQGTENPTHPTIRSGLFRNKKTAFQNFFIDTAPKNAYHDKWNVMHTFRKEEPIVDADPYSKTTYNFTGSGRKEVHPLSA